MHGQSSTGETASAAALQSDMRQEPELGDDAISVPDTAQRTDFEEFTEGKEQPTLSQILRAVNLCTASVNTVKDRLGGLTEEVSLMRQDMQKIRERTTAAESRISDLGDKLPPLIAETGSTTCLA